LYYTTKARDAPRAAHFKISTKARDAPRAQAAHQKYPQSKRAREESQMSVIGWIILGLIAGFIASKIVNRSGEGLILDIILGVVGAVVGGWLFSFFGAEGVSGLNLYSMVVAIIGAIVVLFIYHAITGQRATR
jgi:uncharacterized membrane protein YeaQ/YmgE (transglycosylase-associated protein family)